LFRVLNLFSEYSLSRFVFTKDNLKLILAQVKKGNQIDEVLDILWKASKLITRRSTLAEIISVFKYLTEPFKQNKQNAIKIKKGLFFSKNFLGCCLKIYLITDLASKNVSDNHRLFEDKLKLDYLCIIENYLRQLPPIIYSM
jgi:hypothetical protein